MTYEGAKRASEVAGWDTEVAGRASKAGGGRQKFENKEVFYEVVAQNGREMNEGIAGTDCYTDVLLPMHIELKEIADRDKKPVLS